MKTADFLWEYRAHTEYTKAAQAQMIAELGNPFK